jgi:hypothetical protein
MNNDDIIRLAIEHTINGLKFNEDGLLRFAKLVAQHEREACAELRHKLTPFDLHNRSEMLGVMNQGLDDYQDLIRARGQA